MFWSCKQPSLTVSFSILATALASLRASFPTVLVAPAIRAVRDEAEPEVYAEICGKGGTVIEETDGKWERVLRDKLSEQG